MNAVSDAPVPEMLLRRDAAARDACAAFSGPQEPLRLKSCFEDMPSRRRPRGQARQIIVREHAMTKPPPTPPENRSPKGTGDDKPAETGAHKAGSTNPNTKEQGRQ